MLHAEGLKSRTINLKEGKIHSFFKQEFSEFKIKNNLQIKKVKFIEKHNDLFFIFLNNNFTTAFEFCSVVKTHFRKTKKDIFKKEKIIRWNLKC